ncbi:peptidoglycan recognition family protein [Actinocrispum sp. NPDC049592]|uniref:peptidoglycan recognition protein family protein n=1 Tax=Actinocrispum sp. NPDC049592 TaxID=3154835 RepID=UPI003414A9DB
MITRRSMLAGAAGVAGTVLFGGTAQAAACGPDVELRARPDLAVTVRSRAGWGANENHRFDSAGKEIWPAEFYKIQAVTVHHAGYDDGKDPVAAVRDIYYNHAVTSGYGDIGYHLLIDWNGVVYEGRYSGTDCVPVLNPSGLAVNAAHVVNYNAANVGICLLHNLSTVQPTQAALDALTRTAAVLCSLSKLDPTATIKYTNPINNKTATVPSLSGHRDWAETECPGNLLYPQLPQIRANAKKLL